MQLIGKVLLACSAHLQLQGKQDQMGIFPNFRAEWVNVKRKKINEHNNEFRRACKNHSISSDHAAS